jgi:hypothetical protein
MDSIITAMLNSRLKMLVEPLEIALEIVRKGIPEFELYAKKGREQRSGPESPWPLRSLLPSRSQAHPRGPYSASS